MAPDILQVTLSVSALELCPTSLALKRIITLTLRRGEDQSAYFCSSRLEIECIRSSRFKPLLYRTFTCILARVLMFIYL